MKLEIDEQKKVIEEKLEQLGFGDFQKLRSSIAAVITLDELGISQEKIIGICRNLYSDSNRFRKDWSRSRNWDAGFVNDNNGHFDQGYGYDTSY